MAGALDASAATAAAALGSRRRQGASMERLNKILAGFHKSDMARVKWLDKLTFRKIEKINQEVRLRTHRSEFGGIDVQLTTFFIFFF